jgi:hypothetical protein
MGSTSADTVMLTLPRSDARIWNRSTKFVRSLTQAKTVELSLTSSTPDESSKTIRTLNNNRTSAADWRHCNITVIKYKNSSMSLFTPRRCMGKCCYHTMHSYPQQYTDANIQFYALCALKILTTGWDVVLPSKEVRAFWTREQYLAPARNWTTFPWL